jgi:raffinose/stachyose/melibiose transport system permease protein
VRVLPLHLRRRRAPSVAPPRWFLLGALALYALFFAGPTLSSFYYGLTDWDGLNPSPAFVGLDNFISILTQDSDATNALWNTVRYAVLVTVLGNVLGLSMALLLGRAGRWQTLLRTIYFAPAVLSAVVVGFTWEYILNANVGLGGIVAAIAPSVQLPDFLADPGLVLYVLAGIAVWQGLGITTVIYLAALATVPVEITDAALIDGAGRWMRFWSVTFPLIAPAFTVNVLLGMIGGLKVFDLVYVMTQGGPGGASDVLSTRIFQDGFETQHYGYATALGDIMFVLVFALCLSALLALRRRELRA